MNKIFLAVLVFGFAMAAAAPSNADTKWPKDFLECSNDHDCFRDGVQYGRCCRQFGVWGMCQEYCNSNRGEKLKCEYDMDCPGPFCCIQGSCAHYMYCD